MGHPNGSSGQANGTASTKSGGGGSGVVLKKQISLLNGIGLVIGSIVGSGIFVSPKGVVQEVHSVGLSLIIWAACGFMAICGAMCYAELGTSVVKSGGDYAYAYEGFGPLVGFLYMWAALIIVIPTTNAIIALATAQYILQPFYPTCDVHDTVVRLVAAAVICLLCFVNAWSVKVATRLNDVLSVSKVLALILVIILGFVYIGKGHTENFEEPFADSNLNPGSIAVAIYAGIFSFAGWNTLNFLTEELKNPLQNLPRAIYFSLSTVTIIYVLTNVAYFVVLSPRTLIESDAVAVTFAERTMGFMSWIMPILVALSTFGSLNGLVLAFARMFFVGARDGLLPEVLAMISVHWLTPMPSVIFMCFCSLLMLISGNVYTLITYTSFVESTFFGVSVIAMLYLRWKRPEMPRPLKVSLFWPVTFLIIWAFLMVFPLIYSPRECGMGLLITLIGIPVYVIGVKWTNKPEFLIRCTQKFTLTTQRLLLVVPEETEEPDEEELKDLKGE